MAKAKNLLGSFLSRLWSKISLHKQGEQETAFLVGFSKWKTFMELWLPDAQIVNCGTKLHEKRFLSWVAPQMRAARHPTVYVWSFLCPDFLVDFCKENGIPLIRVEDGFLRSISLGATKVPPVSLCMDSRTLYFDATRASTLEQILLEHDFEKDGELVARARAGIARMINSRLSKYNTGNSLSAGVSLYGPKTRKRILVVGQVEGDMSIVKGCSSPISNNEAVRIAARENPDAEIIYRPHPEVMAGFRKDQQTSDPNEVAHLAHISTISASLADALETIDHVYTITSLAGFEALLRGIEVTCLGAPFYSNWGLTDDRQEVSRRTRKLTIEELFAGAYLLYPTYRHPYDGHEITFEQALDLLAEMKKEADSEERAAAAEKEQAPRAAA